MGKLILPTDLTSCLVFSMSGDEKHPVVMRASPEPSSDPSLVDIRRADDVRLAELGYKSEFKREFSVSKCQR